LNVGTDPLAASKTSRLLEKAAPAFDLPLLDGGSVSSDDLAGKTVIVNFWNEWCEPCLAELPALKDFWTAHQGDSDLAMVGIAHASYLSDKKLAQYAQEEGLDWTIALDPKSKAALEFGIRGQPETFVISPSGEVVGYQLSQMSRADLEAMLAASRGMQ
ncbi:MAG TPA: TlpA disulfide reductase family protein, partial [Acidimicrobiia bacterium]|nr:TlpA disulfide reductase family protein [Acidimicrobiia bacterium]